MDLNGSVSRRIRNVIKTIGWVSTGFPVPSPDFVKRKVLLRHGRSDVWVETGTYLGDTTEFFSKIANVVYTLEPSDFLFENAAKRFGSKSKVKVLHGTSEEKLTEVIELILHSEHKIISFWLDGHYSAGNTFKGLHDTPVMFELKIIEALLQSSNEVRIFIDDVRCFDPSKLEYSTYPAISELINWCQAHHMSWQIEHDILIITKTP
jgi:hypothetical protein